MGARRLCGRHATLVSAGMAVAVMASIVPAASQKSAAGKHARMGAGGSGVSSLKGANTDITGLEMEDVVGNLRSVLQQSSDSLRMSSLNLGEVSKMTQELQDAVAKKFTGPAQKRWLEAGNVARFNGLHPDPYITIPVDINLVFIGFSGDGHYKLNLAEEELKPWFEHMEHLMEHTLVPTNDSPDQSHPTRKTHVYYRYKFHVLELHPDVDAIIEALIWDNARPEDPWSEGAIKWTSQDMHQVDVTPVENALADLVDVLRLNTSYTLFLMNPKLPYPDFNYGYRYGFSKPELDRLHENATLVRQLLSRDKVRPVLQMSPELKDDVHTLFAQVQSFKGEDPEEKARTLKRQRAKLERLVQEKSAAVDGEEREKEREAGHDDAHAHRRKGGTIHKGLADKPRPRGHPKYEDMRELSQTWAALYKQALHDLQYWQRHPAEEDEEVEDEDQEAAYAATLKTLLGTRRDKPLPPDMLFEVMATRLVQSRQGADREYFRAAAEDKHTQEDCIVDNWVGSGRFAFIDFSAGPFEWGPIVGGKRVRSFRTIPDIVSLQTSATDFTAGGKWKDPGYVNKIHRDLLEHGLEKLQDEKKLLLVFLNQDCGDAVSGAAADTCQEMRHKLSAVEAFIKTHARLETSDEATLQQLSFVTGGPHEGANISLVQHSMFAKLGHLIQSTQRQVITPSASALPAPYAATIYFHVYLISNHQSYNPAAPQHFDWPKFKAEVEQFRLPRQSFHFVLHKYSMSEDHALAVAYANALRSAVVATLKVDGRFVATKRMYLDSQVLQKHLQLLHQDGGLRGHMRMEEPGVNKRDIPIFLFSMDVPLPVFIDKHYQARALEDMVIAVQSDAEEWESHLSCNGKAIVWNLRNPLRAMLSATVHHLAGVLPMHLTYDDAHGKVSQDWLWSVGCSALSHTTARLANFSQMHVDAAHRNIIAELLSQSLEYANQGVRALQATGTNLDNLPASAAVPHDRLVQMHVAVRLSWSRALQDVHRLDFQNAVPNAHTAVRNARHFRDLAVHTQELLLLSSCLNPVHNKPFDWNMVMMVAAAVVCVAIYYLVLPSRTKAKLN